MAGFGARPAELNETLIRFQALDKLGVLAQGAALVAYGLRRRTVPGFALAGFAALITYREITGRWPVRLSFLKGNGGNTREALAGERGIHVRESIYIERPVTDVYRFWRKLEHLPRFMANLERVTELGDGKSHWVASGPAGLPVEWDAEIINEVEDKVIGWRSLEGSDVVTAGSVNFRPTRNERGTDVSVHLQYAPPAGRVGSWLAAIAGREPSQTIREDLRRLKYILEADEVRS